MFFSIGRTMDDRLDCYYDTPDWQISVDKGWTACYGDHKLVLFKGYCDQLPVQELINNTTLNQEFLTGNFCMITVEDESGVKIIHNHPRSFPLWYKNNYLTNFSPDDQSLTPVWVDSVVNMSNDGTFCFTKMPKIQPLRQSNTLDGVVDQIVQLLSLRGLQFKQQYPLLIDIYLSGGLDTSLVQALCNNVGIDTALINESISPTAFVSRNSKTLNHFWAYQQLHCQENPSCIATGSHGDEVFLRGPDAISLITAWYDIDFLSVLDQHRECYHYYYFSLPENQNKFSSQYKQRASLREHYPTWEKLCFYILDRIANDHQHWHIGNTMSWTPLKELEIARLCLTLPIDVLIDNFLNGSITRECIKKLDSTILHSIDQFKNL